MRFFEGEREIARFIIRKGAKQLAICSVYEEWMPLLKESIKCGASLSVRVTKRLGVSKTEINSLEETVKGKMGIKSLLELEDSIKETLKSEQVWSDFSETERNVEFRAPECGRYDAEQFQLFRKTQITLKKDRFFRKPEVIRKTIGEPLHVFHDNSKITNSDQSCNCDDKKGENIDGYFVGTVANLTMNIPYSFIREGLVLLFEENSKKLLQSDSIGATIQIPIDWLNESQKILLDEVEDPLLITLAPRTGLEFFQRPRYYFEEIDNLLGNILPIDNELSGIYSELIRRVTHSRKISDD